MPIDLAPLPETSNTPPGPTPKPLRVIRVPPETNTWPRDPLTPISSDVPLRFLPARKDSPLRVIFRSPPVRRYVPSLFFPRPTTSMCWMLRLPPDWLTVPVPSPPTTLRILRPDFVSVCVPPVTLSVAPWFTMTTPVVLSSERSTTTSPITLLITSSPGAEPVSQWAATLNSPPVDGPTQSSPNDAAGNKRAVAATAIRLRQESVIRRTSKI